MSPSRQSHRINKNTFCPLCGRERKRRAEKYEPSAFLKGCDIENTFAHARVASGFRNKSRANGEKLFSSGIGSAEAKASGNEAIWRRPWKFSLLLQKPIFHRHLTDSGRCWCIARCFLFVFAFVLAIQQVTCARGDGSRFSTFFGDQRTSWFETRASINILSSSLKSSASNYSYFLGIELMKLGLAFFAVNRLFCVTRAWRWRDWRISRKFIIAKPFRERLDGTWTDETKHFAVSNSSTSPGGFKNKSARLDIEQDSYSALHLFGRERKTADVKRAAK